MLELIYCLLDRKLISDAYDEVIALNPQENDYVKSLRIVINKSNNKIVKLYLKNLYLNNTLCTALSNK